MTPEFYQKIIDELERDNRDSNLVEKSQFFSNNLWGMKIYDILEEFAQKQDMHLVMSEGKCFNGLAIWPLRTVVLHASSFDDAISLGYLIARYMDCKEPIDPPQMGGDLKSFYLDFYDENYQSKYRLKAEDAISHSGAFSDEIKNVASTLLSLLFFHECAHIAHRHGSRHCNIDSDGITTSKEQPFKTLSEASDKHARELVCDSFAVNILLENYLAPQLDNLDINDKLHIIVRFYALVSLHIYFLSGDFGRDNFPLCIYPPVEFRMHHLYLDLRNDNILKLDKFDIELVEIRSKELVQAILRDVFSDPYAEDWMSNTQHNIYYRMWYETSVYPKLKEWAPYRG